MAKKAAGRRKRRTPEEMIKDLEAEIERVRSRKAARELKASEAHKATLMAIRNLDKALETAKAEGETQLAHVLADARTPVADYLTSKGVALPKARRPRGRRPKED